MKQSTIKTFKCKECNDINPTFKFDYPCKRLVDARKYIGTKIVCKRCYDRIRERNKNGT